MLLRVKLSVIIIHEHCFIIFLICKNLNIHVYNNYILYIYIYIHNYTYIYIYINVYMYIKIDIYYILNNIKLYIYIL